MINMSIHVIAAHFVYVLESTKLPDPIRLQQACEAGCRGAH